MAMMRVSLVKGFLPGPGHSLWMEFQYDHAVSMLGEVKYETSELYMKNMTEWAKKDDNYIKAYSSYE